MTIVIYIVMILFWFYFSGLSNMIIRKIFSHWRLELVYSEAVASGCGRAYAALQTSLLSRGEPQWNRDSDYLPFMFFFFFFCLLLLFFFFFFCCCFFFVVSRGNLYRNSLICCWLDKFHRTEIPDYEFFGAYADSEVPDQRVHRMYTRTLTVRLQNR